MISELSTIEIFSAFGNHCRKNKHSLSRYKAMEQAFWKDVVEERITIRETTFPDLQRARHLLQHAGVEKKRKIGSGDAVIAASCLGVAIEQSVPVTFCLEDWTLYSIIREVRAYTSVLSFKYIGVDKSAAPAA